MAYSLSKTKDNLTEGTHHLIYDGWTTDQLKNWYMSEKGYQQSYAYELARKCHKQISEWHREEAAEMFASTYTKVMSIYTKSLKKGNDKLALEALDMINRMSGNYKDRVEHSFVNYEFKWGDETKGIDTTENETKDDFFDID